jgi:hypothetical protein
MKLNDLEKVIQLGRDIRHAQATIEKPDELWPASVQNYLSDDGNKKILQIIRDEHVKKLAGYVAALTALGVEVEYG